ncbi:MAG: hypothetical protein GWP70_00995 [Proteobacteria bacterium]|nr:hypothetical protein [Pseudomonadota bacterium]
MSFAFAHIPTQHLAKIAQSVVLTPNERLARELSAAFDEAMLSSGAKAWPTLKCQSLRSFWLEQFQQLKQTGNITAELLSEHQINLRFQQAAPAGFGHQCRLASATWLLTRRYQIDLDDPLIEQGRSAYFRDWCHQAVPAEANGCLVAEDLPALLTLHTEAIVSALPGPIVLVDVEHLAPAEDDFFAKLAEGALCKVSLLAQQTWHPHYRSDLGQTNIAATPLQHGAEVSVQGYASLGHELMAAAQWCQTILSTRPEAKIGVVVPDLSASYDRVLRQFSATLAPHQDSREPPFDLSGGKSLASQPVWQHAKVLLNWINRPADQATLAPMLHSPYLSLPWCEGLKQQWPKWARRQLTPAALARRTDAGPTHPFLAALSTLPSKARLDVWIEHMVNLLDLAQWPRSHDLGSIQFQATVKIRQTLSALAAESAEILLQYTQALELIDWALEQTFAPQRQTARIQILGMLETTGLQFTHLWVCGMSAEKFPGRSKLSAFIPRQLAVAHGMPRSTQSEELEFAQRTLRGWRERSQVLRLSFTDTDSGTSVAPSPLVADLLERQIDSTKDVCASLTGRNPLMQPSHVALQRSQDANGSALAAGPVSGGTGRLEQHAQCQFKSYALHRLKLREATPARDFLNAMERGNSLHWVMERLFQRYPDSHAATTQTNQVIEELCAQAIARYTHLPPPFISQEQDRLAALVQRWLTLEAQRLPFRVLQTEQQYTLDLGPLQFALRIDRLDEVNGVLVVIDYKSGKVSTGPALNEQLSAPQLPAYSLIRDDIGGVYYAQVRDDECKLVGLAGATE